VHLEGHFLGDPLLRYTHPSIGETLKMAIPLVKAHTQTKGASLRERTAGLKEMLELIRENGSIHRSNEGDPIIVLRRKLAGLGVEKLEGIEKDVQADIESIVHQINIPAEQMGGQ
jgi:hypothetical protein